MAIAMVAMLAFGGTYAYFTATSTTNNSDTVNLGIIQLGETTVEIADTITNVLPGETISNIEFTIEDMSNRASYIFVTVTGEILKTADGATAESLDIALTTDTGTATTGVLKSATVTVGSESVTVYYILTEDDVDNTTTAAEYTCTTSVTLDTSLGNEYQGATVTITLSAESIQAPTFDDAAEAYLALLEEQEAA